jgi:hypothetical protein
MLTARQRIRNRRFGRVRAKVEHVFRVMKYQFGYRKVRYRGIAKNGAQVSAGPNGPTRHRRGDELRSRKTCSDAPDDRKTELLRGSLTYGWISAITGK